jgi:hypothetical protein
MTRQSSLYAKLRAETGVYLKKSELILRAIGSAGGIPPK